MSFAALPFFPSRGYMLGLLVGSRASTVRTDRSHYIVGRGFDWAFFLLPPMLALGLGIAVSNTWFSTRAFMLFGEELTGSSLALQVLVHGHLVAVLLRTHGNAGVFKLHPWRFMVVPPLLYITLLLSDWALAIVSVLATFWDVYHSALQTFGFARIYDRKAGNDPELGRRLDWWLNQLLYVGPILAGATMLDHVEDFEHFESVGATFFTRIPALMSGSQQVIAWVIIGLGSVFVAVYVGVYRCLYRRGYKVSPLKVYLLASTGFCSIYTWGLNSWGEAFLIMNVFHAVQYLALVWAMEGRRLVAALPLGRMRGGACIGAGLFLLVTLGYGLWVATLDVDIRSLWAITMVVSIMHFWYDGFIWSVRRRQI